MLSKYHEGKAFPAKEISDRIKPVLEEEEGGSEISVKIREVWIGTGVAQGERVYTCEYALLVQEMEEGGLEQYGVQVTLKETGETAQILAITPFASQALELCEQLRRNTVTPCTLRDVIEDWL